MRINDACKPNSRLLPKPGFPQQIIVLREKHSAQFRGTIKQQRIRQSSCTVLLRCQDISTSQAQAFSYCAANMNIHKKFCAHKRFCFPLDSIALNYAKNITCGNVENSVGLLSSAS